MKATLEANNIILIHRKGLLMMRTDVFGFQMRLAIYPCF